MAITKVSYSMIAGASVNVLDYGADSTGVADSTVAIQTAIDTAATAGGGIVFLPVGTYLANNLNIKQGVSIIGAGVKATIIKNTSAANHAIYSLVALADWSVENLTIQNTNVLCLDGIHIAPATGTSRRWTIRNVRVEGGNNAVYLVNCYLGSCDNLDILLGLGGRLVNGLVLGDGVNPSNANTFNTVWVTAASGNGIYLNKATTNTFNSPTVQSCTGIGINALLGSNNVYNSPYFEANTGVCDFKTANDCDSINSPYMASTLTTNSIVVNGRTCVLSSPNLPNAGTPKILFDVSALRCTLIGGFYAPGFNPINSSIQDNGTDTLFYSDAHKRRVEVLAIAASAGLVYNADVYTYGGNADITTLNATWAGHEITILFSGNAAVTGMVKGGNLLIASNFSYTTNDSIKLYCDGTNWIELSRSVN